MFTDALPRKNRAEYLKSDRIKSLDLPQTSVLPNIAKDLEAEGGQHPRRSQDMRRVSEHRLTFLSGSELQRSGARRETAAGS